MSTDTTIAHLHVQREALLSQWLHALLETGFASASVTTTRHQLALLLDQFFGLVQSDTPDRVAARRIGITLADLHFVQDDAIAATYEVLYSGTLTLVPAHDQAVLAVRLMPLLSAIATGWVWRVRQLVLAEQERVRRALQMQQERVKAELRQSENRLRTVITGAPVVLFTIDCDGYTTMAEGCGMERLPSVMVDYTTSIFDDAPHPGIPGYVRRALAGEMVQARVDVDGAIFEVRYAPLTNDRAETMGVIGVALDITDQIQAETELEQMRRRLAERIEQEQQRIARELHDDTVQRLIATGYQITNALRRADQQADEASQALHLALAIERVRNDILDTAERVRGIVGDLRPPGLDELGISSALTEYIQKLLAETETGPAIVLDLESFPVGSLPSSTALTLFRCAQEALRNALRHAHAEHITIRLYRQDKTLILHVEDDGCGFVVPDTLHPFVQDNHFGLAGMAERAAIEGGTLKLFTQPGKGTIVTITLPRSVADRHQRD